MDKILLCCCLLASALVARPSANTNELRSVVQDARPENVDREPIYVRIRDRLELTDAFHPAELKASEVVARKSFFLLGEIAEQGPREFEGDMTIWEAVMLNRPDMRTANLGSVRLIRPDPHDPVLITVDIARMNLTGDSSLNVHVQEGDLVYVPPSPSVPELLAQASAGMEAFAQGASAPDAERVRQLVAQLQAVATEFERLAR